MKSLQWICSQVCGPPACSLPYPFASLSLHCYFRFSAILACFFLPALAESSSRRCAASLRSSTQSTGPFVCIPARFQTRVSEPAFHFNCFFASSLSSAVQFFLAPFSFVFCLSSHPFSLSVPTGSCSKLAPAVR